MRTIDASQLETVTGGNTGFSFFGPLFASYRAAKEKKAREQKQPDAERK